MPAARYVRPLTTDEHQVLQETYRATHDADLRTRCQMILLSGARQSVADIASVTFFDQDTVLYWLDRYEAEGLTGLAERPRSGRPPKSR